MSEPEKQPVASTSVTPVVLPIALGLFFVAVFATCLFAGKVTYVYWFVKAFFIQEIAGPTSVGASVGAVMVIIIFIGLPILIFRLLLARNMHKGVSLLIGYLCAIMLVWYPAKASFTSARLDLGRSQQLSISDKSNAEESNTLQFRPNPIPEHEKLEAKEVVLGDLILSSLGDQRKRFANEIISRDSFSITCDFRPIDVFRLLDDSSLIAIESGWFGENSISCILRKDTMQIDYFVRGNYSGTLSQTNINKFDNQWHRLSIEGSGSRIVMTVDDIARSCTVPSSRRGDSFNILCRRSRLEIKNLVVRSLSGFKQTSVPSPLPTVTPPNQAAEGTFMSLADGDTVRLRCSGNTHESSAWLTGDPKNGTVTLSEAPAENMNTQWLVSVYGDVIALSCKGDKATRAQKWLDGRTVEGTLGLARNIRQYSGTRWRMHLVGKQEFWLECLGNIKGLHMLRGDKETGQVTLVENAGTVPGTLWEIVKVGKIER